MRTALLKMVAIPRDVQASCAIASASDQELELVLGLIVEAESSLRRAGRVTWPDHFLQSGTDGAVRAGPPLQPLFGPTKRKYPGFKAG